MVRTEITRQRVCTRSRFCGLIEHRTMATLSACHRKDEVRCSDIDTHQERDKKRACEKGKEWQIQLAGS